MNLLREDIREGFARQREALNAKLDAIDSKVAAGDNKVESRFAEYTAQASESKIGRRWLVGIAIGVGITAAGLVGQYLPAMIKPCNQVNGHFHSGGPITLEAGIIAVHLVPSPLMREGQSLPSRKRGMGAT